MNVLIRNKQTNGLHMIFPSGLKNATHFQKTAIWAIRDFQLNRSSDTARSFNFTVSDLTETVTTVTETVKKSVPYSSRYCTVLHLAWEFTGSESDRELLELDERSAAGEEGDLCQEPDRDQETVVSGNSSRLSEDTVRLNAKEAAGCH